MFNFNYDLPLSSGILVFGSLVLGFKINFPWVVDLKLFVGIVVLRSFDSLYPSDVWVASK